MKYFPPFRFDEQASVLFRDGLAVPLSRKALGLLQCLVATPRAVVTHQRIMESVWSDTHVQPENIKTVVHELRAVLGDRSQSPQFIRSAPGRGYVFVADVTDAMPPLFSDSDNAARSTLIGRNTEVGILARPRLLMPSPTASAIKWLCASRTATASRSRGKKSAMACSSTRLR
jgi:DNA-binding winged helix-turn-helix (wHTH) protein